MQRRAFLAGMPLALAGCAGEAVWAPDDSLARVVHRAGGPASITLYTVKNSSSGNGAHTGLLINASQRVIFDPAGSFANPATAERNDVVFGITDAVEAEYTRFNSSDRYYTIKLRREVPAAVAETALALYQTAGPVAKAHCTRVTSTVLRQLPGFEALRVTFFPDNLMAQFLEFFPDLTASFHYLDEDEDRAQAVALYRSQVEARLGAAAAPA